MVQYIYEDMKKAKKTMNRSQRRRFDVEMKDFNDMMLDLGGNYYKYNHTTVFALPDPSHGQSQGGNWTGDLRLYIKCRDSYNHETPGYYTIDMCVKEGPDKTPPMIRATEPGNNAIVGYNISLKNVTIITNELATCKWDASDVDYSVMENEMKCNDGLKTP